MAADLKEPVVRLRNNHADRQAMIALFRAVRGLGHRLANGRYVPAHAGNRVAGSQRDHRRQAGDSGQFSHKQILPVTRLAGKPGFTANRRADPRRGLGEFLNPSGKAWWARQGLNLRPHPCEGCALPLSYAPTSCRLSADDAAKRRRVAPPCFREKGGAFATALPCAGGISIRRRDVQTGQITYYPARTRRSAISSPHPSGPCRP